MFLFYVFKDGSWEFWESIKWQQLFNVIYDLEVDINAYLNIEFVENLPNFGRWCIDENRFLYDMIHYRQYVSDEVTVYYIDVPG